MVACINKRNIPYFYLYDDNDIRDGLDDQIRNYQVLIHTGTTMKVSISGHHFHQQFVYASGGSICVRELGHLMDWVIHLDNKIVYYYLDERGGSNEPIDHSAIRDTLNYELRINPSARDKYNHVDTSIVLDKNKIVRVLKDNMWVWLLIENQKEVNISSRYFGLLFEKMLITKGYIRRSCDPTLFDSQIQASKGSSEEDKSSISEEIGDLFLKVPYEDIVLPHANITEEHSPQNVMSIPLTESKKLKSSPRLEAEARFHRDHEAWSQSTSFLGGDPDLYQRQQESLNNLVIEGKKEMYRNIAVPSLDEINRVKQRIKYKFASAEDKFILQKKRYLSHFKEEYRHRITADQWYATKNKKTMKRLLNWQPEIELTDLDIRERHRARIIVRETAKDLARSLFKHEIQEIDSHQYRVIQSICQRLGVKHSHDTLTNITEDKLIGLMEEIRPLAKRLQKLFPQWDDTDYLNPSFEPTADPNPDFRSLTGNLDQFLKLLSEFILERWSCAQLKIVEEIPDSEGSKNRVYRLYIPREMEEIQSWLMPLEPDPYSGREEPLGDILEEMNARLSRGE